MTPWKATLLLLTLACIDCARGGSLTLTIVDGDGLPLPDAVASLHGDEPSSAPPGTQAELRQQDLQFQPPVLAVQVGTEVEFPNLDRIAHHVYSFSEAKRFELRLYRGRPEQPVRFDTPGTVVLGCNVHDWMLGYVYVLDTPWFALSDAEGEIDLQGVPPGDYELRAWHPRLRGEMPFIALPIEVREQPAKGVRLALDVDPPDPRFLSPRQRSAGGVP